MPMSSLESTMDMSMGIISAAVGTVSIISGIVALISILALWRIMRKMGEPGWYAIVPFFNMFVIAQHSFGNGFAMFVPLIPVVGIPWFFMQLFRGFGLDTVPALLLAVFAAPIGMFILGFNRTPWMGM